jgi:hypothetical protein
MDHQLQNLAGFCLERMCFRGRGLAHKLSVPYGEIALQVFREIKQCLTLDMGGEAGFKSKKSPLCSGLFKLMPVFISAFL